MKLLNMKYLVLLLFSVALFTACNDDDPETETSIFVGNYVINNSEISEAFFLNTNEMGEIAVPLNTDITQAIQTSLLSQIDCSSADKSWVELRKDKSMYMSCEGANELNAGTWVEVSETVLKLNMNGAAIPSSPTGFVLEVSNIVISGANMSGETSVPLPKEMIAGMIAPLSLSADNPDVFMVKFSIVFVKK